MYVKLRLIQDVAALRKHRWAESLNSARDDYIVAMSLVNGGEVKIPKENCKDGREVGVVEIVRQYLREKEKQRLERLNCPWK